MNPRRTPAGSVTRRRRAVLAALIAGALAPGLAGCSLRGADPAKTTRSASADPRSTAGAGSSVASGASGAAGPSAGAGSSVGAMVARANRTHEVPTPPGRQAVAGGWRSPTQAVYVFAMQYINWNSQDVSARLRALARVSVGQARSAASAAASETASDDVLKRGQIANTGVVEAIAPLLGHRYEYAVATRERTTAAATDAYEGIAPAWHLALATVTRLASGVWVLSDWQPEN